MLLSEKIRSIFKNSVLFFLLITNCYNQYLKFDSSAIIRREKQSQFSQYHIVGNNEIWDLIGFLPENKEMNLRRFLSYSPGYRITLEDLVSGRGIAQFTKAYLKEIDKEGLFDEFIEQGKNEISGKSVSLALENGTEEQKAIARLIYQRISNYLGMGIASLVLNTGEKREIAWSKQDWAYWKDVKEIILGGFIHGAGEESDILISGAESYLKSIGLADIHIRKAPLKSKEAGILGGVVYLVSQGVLSSQDLNEGVISIDFGRSWLGTAIVSAGSNKSDVVTSSLSTCYNKEVPVKTGIKTPDGGTVEDRNLLLKQFVQQIVEAIDYAQRKGINISNSIVFSSIGMLNKEGYFVAGTHYLPKWQKKDGFRLSDAITAELDKSGYHGFGVYLLNDGEAAALGNVYYESIDSRHNLVAYIGLGSGLGGGLIEKKE